MLALYQVGKLETRRQVTPHSGLREWPPDFFDPVPLDFLHSDSIAETRRSTLRSPAMAARLFRTPSQPSAHDISCMQQATLYPPVTSASKNPHWRILADTGGCVKAPQRATNGKRQPRCTRSDRKALCGHFLAVCGRSTGWIVAPGRYPGLDCPPVFFSPPSPTPPAPYRRILAETAIRRCPPVSKITHWRILADSGGYWRIQTVQHRQSATCGTSCSGAGTPRGR